MIHKILSRLFRLSAPLMALALLGMAACSPLINLGPETPAANIFRLEPVSEPVTDALADWTVVIAKPTTIGSLNTSMMAVKTAPLEVRYYADARWSDRLPDMIQSLLIDSFEAGGGAVALTTDSAASLAPYILEADIRDFQADVRDKNAPEVRVRLTLRLTSASPTRLLASTTVAATALAEGTDAAQLAAAFNEAMQDVLRRTLLWTADQMAATPIS